MKASDDFKKAIQNYLIKRAETEEGFIMLLAKPNKSIEDCITYILNQVKQSGNSAFTDAEVYGMAVHYFDEDNIEVGSPVECRVVHAPEALNQEETNEEPEALDQEENEEEPESINQLSLF